MNQEFILQHRLESPSALALRYHGVEGIDLPYCLEQIESWQKARTKLPRWAATAGLIFPPRLAMEQCSGEVASEYKKEVIKESLTPRPDSSFVDLTGGFGVDFSALAPLFAKATYVERQPHLCDIARHNLPLLGLPGAKVVNAEAEDYLQQMPPQTLIYLDPARRDAHGGKVVDLNDCSPRLPELLPLLLQKAQVIMVKLSPMLDWHRAVEQLRGVTEVHIVATDGEVKELLIVMMADGGVRKTEEAFKLYACSLTPNPSPKGEGSIISFIINPKDRRQEKVSTPLSLWRGVGGETFPYLYEPNPALMKAGLFSELAERYALRQISPNSHLFIGNRSIDFPGRRFQISAISSMNKRELRHALQGITQANIAVRNFPLSAEALRKKLKLRDGGDVYLFATTTADGQHVIIICKKAL